MFDEIVGNNKVKESLKRIISNGDISHSYIFSGPEGIGKSMVARQFAKSVLCSSEELANHPDYFEIQADGNSIKIEQIRAMQKNTQLTKRH